MGTGWTPADLDEPFESSKWLRFKLRMRVFVAVTVRATIVVVVGIAANSALRACTGQEPPSARPSPSTAAFASPTPTSDPSLEAFISRRRMHLEYAQRLVDETSLSPGRLKRHYEYNQVDQRIVEYVYQHLKVDWQEEADALASTWLKDWNYSESALTQTLLDEGFAEDQTRNAMDKLNADWQQEAIDAAQEFHKGGLFPTHRAMVDALMDGGFTKQQAETAAREVGLK